MNKDIIMSMVTPYIKDGKLTYDDFDKIFASILSQREQYSVSDLLVSCGIEFVDEYIETDSETASELLKKVSSYSRNGYITYENFEKLFAKHSRKEQYELVEELFANGIELIDQYETNKNLSELSIEALTDPVNITIEDRSTDSFEILYDNSIFLDKRTTNTYLTVNKNIKQSNSTLCELIQAGNLQACQDLCVKNELLVLKYANAYLGYYGSSLELDDLVQAGYIGLLSAAKRFDKEMDNAFTTYAVFWIKQAISREIFDYGFAVRIPVHVMEKIIKITSLERYYDANGLMHSEIIRKIADELDYSIDTVQECILLRQKYMHPSSLNDPIGEEQENELIEFIPDDESLSVEEIVENVVLSEKLNSLVDKLKPREKQVIILRYGIADGKQRTLEEIGKAMNITRERVRQIEKKALTRLRHPSKRKILKDFYE